MHGLYNAGFSGPDPRDSTMLGTSYLFAFEKCMRTGSNEVTINWQADYTTGACVKKVVRPVMARQYIPAAETTVA